MTVSSHAFHNLLLTIIPAFVLYALYRMSQEERSVFWEVIVSVILSKKKVYMYLCPIPNGFRDRAISLYTTLYRRATLHVLTRVAKYSYIDVDGRIFGNVLH
jgi:hypothetical protein